MKELPLSNSNKCSVVDDEDFELASKLGKWQLVTIRYTDYVYKTYEGTTIYLHRFILKPPRNKVIDHINGNGLDNCRTNLRIVSGGVNNLNAKVLRNDNISGIRGISWDYQTLKWRATITLNGRQKSLGRYDNIEDATLARMEAEQNLEEHFPQFFNPT